MLANLAHIKIEKERLSVRRAAREIGISHATLLHLLRGRTLEMTSIEKVCRWLGVPVAAVLGPLPEPAPGSSELAQVVAQLLALAEIGGISEADAREITNFIRWKMQK
jgi:transcriptional regulator with XRE-family HTH domain